MSLPQVDEVSASIERLSDLLQTVETESISIDQIVGRVLASPLRADRPSPALDVSAMDGYALRIEDASTGSIPVADTTCAGSEPVDLPSGSAVRVFTGAAVPAGTDCVIKREDTIESETSIQLSIAIDSLRRDLNVRRQGENTPQGAEILPTGTLIDPAAIAAVASFGNRESKVFRKLRVAILNTGDELAYPGEYVEDWQIRDSNGPTLEAWLSGLPYIELTSRLHVGDTLESVEVAISNALSDNDAILLTGGVSMGDTDYVPKAIENLGGQTVFHRLPIRPGRPVLGAQRNGKLLLGLPGNPVSVAVTSRVIGAPLLRKLAGITPSSLPRSTAMIADADDKQLHLMWYRLVNLDTDDKFRFAKSLGSGDLVSLSRSYGFVEIPIGASGEGPWPLYSWA